jgi:hypothetical protein
MPQVHWNNFEILPGAADYNFEILCRALVRRHYAKYGVFAALASQPGVEFHLKLQYSCPLGDANRWYGWQCRWYSLPSGRPIGATRRKKIEEAIRTTEKELPELTDWVLWTRHTLTKGDQKWYSGLKSHMQLHQWTSIEVEEHLSGEAEILRSTYFGDLVLTPDTLAGLHKETTAQIHQRWCPEVHQTVDAERALLKIIGHIDEWNCVLTLANQLKHDVDTIAFNISNLNNDLARMMEEVVTVARSVVCGLTEAHSAIERGDLEILRQQFIKYPIKLDEELAVLPRLLRARRHLAALAVTNTISSIRSAYVLIHEINTRLTSKLVAILADAGCGKTQLAAQLTSASNYRPAGILLYGRELHAGHNLDNLAQRVVIHGIPVPSMEALIAAVDAAGQRACRRLPIVIDGLNEAEDPRDWKGLLATLNVTLNRYPYVLVVCTLRESFAHDALPLDIDRLEIPDFDQDTGEAVRRYFEYYQINPVDAVLPWGLLRHPLTLRLFCEVTNPKREREVGIEAMPGSLTALFDRYLEQAAERIAELAPRTRRYYVQDVRSALDEIGWILWEEGVRSLELKSLRYRLGDSERAWNESIIYALEQDGVLLSAAGDTSGGRHVAVVYDALAGHLVADAIVSRCGRIGFERWIKETTTATALNGPISEQHPLAIDTIRALVGLVPRRLHRQQLWQLLDGTLLVIALFESAKLEGAFLDAQTVSELAIHVSQQPIGSRDLLFRLQQTRSAPAHPLNADFLDSVLRSMSVADRDLRWSEWIRRQQDDIFADLQRLENRWKDNPERNSSELLRAKWAMWTLTSTIRKLRDYATRALYWFGRHDPNALFALTLDALTINDPYVPERLLASSYGVAMALYADPENGKAMREALPEYVSRLYAIMFAPDSVYGTTHALMRDYARFTIELARILTPSLLSDEQVHYITPPFTVGGIREWGELEPDKTEQYPDRAFGMDFKNYTIGRLVPGRHNYDDNHLEYQRVLRQMRWRYKQIGYSPQMFGEIDNQISRGASYSRSESNSSRIDRYGKKYLWITYFEQYGLRDDLGTLRNSKRDYDCRDPRPTDVDIDPSFPESPNSTAVINEDLLGDRELSLDAWLLHGPGPYLERYLVIDEIDGDIGPWVLLDGFVEQEDESANRDFFAFPRGLFVAQVDAEAFVTRLASQSLGGRWLPEIPEDYYIFAGEIPWSPFFSSNGWVQLQFGDDYEAANYDDLFNVLVPVRDHSWESYHSGANKSHGAYVPARELAESLGLWLRLPTWDFCDQTGRRVTCLISASSSYKNTQKLLYIRCDALEQYLCSQGLALVWGVWGERRVAKHEDVMARKDANSDYVDFQQVFVYANGDVRFIDGELSM